MLPALLLLDAPVNAFSALSKTTYSEGGGAGLHPDAIAWQQHLGLNECSPGDLIKGRCGNVGDVAAYIEANRGIDGDGPHATANRYWSTSPSSWKARCTRSPWTVG